MEILHILLRLLHILAAVAWIGLGAVNTIYILPAAMHSGENGIRYLRSLFVQTSIGRLFAPVAGITVLAGILLYVVTNSASYFSSTGNIVLGIGAAAGILAAIHGGAVTGRATTALNEALVKYVPEGAQAIPADALAQVREKADSLLSHSRLSLVLMIIALIGMGTARYL